MNCVDGGLFQVSNREKSFIGFMMRLKTILGHKAKFEERTCSVDTCVCPNCGYIANFIPKYMRVCVNDDKSKKKVCED